MAKKPRDTSFDLSAGIRDTGLNNLTRALGLRGHDIVHRLHNDPDFVAVAGKALVALDDGAAPPEQAAGMDDIKRLMGSRCFLTDEVQRYLGLHHREVSAIPRFTGRQIEQLMTFLKANCPILGRVPAAETHILIPQPSMIDGATFSLRWMFDHAVPRWQMKIENCDRFTHPTIPDSYFNKVRPPQWFLMFWGPRAQSAVPSGTNIDKLRDLGYVLPDLASYALALGYLKQRGIDISSDFHRGGEGTTATLQDRICAVRTAGGGLNLYIRDENPALIRKVPFA